MTITTTAAKVAADIAWNGHASDNLAAQYCAKHTNANAADVLAHAHHTGLIKPAPRIGGWVATSQTERVEFGHELPGYEA